VPYLLNYERLFTDFITRAQTTQIMFYRKVRHVVFIESYQRSAIKPKFQGRGRYLGVMMYGGDLSPYRLRLFSYSLQEPHKKHKFPIKN
jgi:hypothetical protein